MAVRYDSGMAGGFSFPITTPQRQYMSFNDFNGGQNFDADETITLTQAGSQGTMTQDRTVHGGVALFSSGNNGDGNGVNVQMGEIIELDEAGDLFFEVRVRFAATAGTSSLTNEQFIGLAKTGTTAVIASDTMGNVGYLGFTSVAATPTTTAGYIQLVAKNAAGATINGAGASHIKIDTAANGGVGVDDFVRLGIVVRNGSAQAFVNGEKTGAAITGLPTGELMEPTFVAQADDGSLVGKQLVDYYLISCGRSSTDL